MKTMVVGDIHGCGLELQELIAKAGLDKASDQLVLIGDLFDRAKHGHLVWQVIHEWGDRCYCLQGNHERKMLKWLLGERSSVPPHYVWAVDNLRRHLVLKNALVGFLEPLPTILVYSPYPSGGGKIIKDIKGLVKYPLASDVILVHAGIDINWVLNPDPSFTVYGDVKTKGKEWWERYTGESLVVYGHLSELDQQPRLRFRLDGTSDEADIHGLPSVEYRKLGLNSIGIDTACAHGGYLTGYIIETGDIHSVKAHKDWTTELKEEMGLE